jgi:hypothetical protein
LRARFAGELAEQFGSVASPEEIEIAADRRARIEVINDWLDRRGVMADKRSGRPREILATLERSQAGRDPRRPAGTTLRLMPEARTPIAGKRRRPQVSAFNSSLGHINPVAPHPNCGAMAAVVLGRSASGNVGRG